MVDEYHQLLLEKCQFVQCIEKFAATKGSLHILHPTAALMAYAVLLATVFRAQWIC
jgi:hypothetical protein